MENRFKAILIENPYTVRYSNIIKPKSSNNYIVSEERQFVDINFDNSYEVHVIDISNGFYDSSLIVASTKPERGLPSPSKDFLEAFCADPDLIILNCTIFDYDNTCHIEYCSIKDKQKIVEEILEHSLRIGEEINIRRTPPEIVLVEGLKIRYSFSLSKGFPPLLFLSKDCNWQGKYTYKVKVKQQLYFDTNLNHQCRVGNNYFCVKQNIPANLIELVTT